MPTAIPYLRFSSGRQAKGSSYERQSDMIADWLRRNPEYQLSTISFEDLGVSGYHGHHLKEESGFAKLRVAIADGVFGKGDCVIIEAIDRAGRLEPLQMLSLLGEILNAGVEIETLDDGVRYTRESVSNNHLFLLVAKVQQAHLYSQNLSRRLSAAWDSKRKAATSGKSIRRRLPLWFDQETGMLREDIAPLVKQAFEDYAAGFGNRRIYKRLAPLHPEIAAMTPEGMGEWFYNKTAIGYWNETPDVHPAVIDLDLWYRVQMLRESRKRTTIAAPSKHLLAGLVKCGSCGKNFTIKLNKGKSTSMVCKTKSRLGDKGCDNGKAFPTAVLDKIRIDTSLSLVQEAFSNQNLSSNRKRLIEIEGQLQDVAKGLTALGEAIAAAGDVSPFLDSLSSYKRKREELENEKTLLSRETEDKNILLSGIIDLEQDLLEDDHLKLNALLQSVGYQITVYSDGLMIVEGQEYPFLYKGYNRGRDGYVYMDMGEEKFIKRADHEQLEAFKALRKQAPEPDNILLKLIKRGNGRQ